MVRQDGSEVILLDAVLSDGDVVILVTKEDPWKELKGQYDAAKAKGENRFKLKELYEKMDGIQCSMCGRRPGKSAARRMVRESVPWRPPLMRMAAVPF